MNKVRRENLRKALGMLRSSLSIVEDSRDEEDTCLSNIPENLADSERAVGMEDAVDALSAASSCISEAIERIEEVI